MAKSVIADQAEFDGLPEALQSEYEKATDGSFVLRLEGVPRGFVESARLDEMRISSRDHETRATELQTQLGRFEGITDPDKARELIATQSDLDRKALVKAGDIEGLIAAEIAKTNGPLQKELELEREGRKSAQLQADKAVVNTKVVSAAADFGKVRKGAGDVIVSKAQAAGWGNVDGNLLQVNSEGEVIGRDIAEWVATHAAPGGELAFCFEPSTGGGADGGDDDETVATQGGTIDPTDRKAFRENLKDIATGKKQVGALKRSA